ncbi:hypothetical protein N8H69_04210 [Achromobacter spanius]|uniref:hypothetical protein n=1 Tax=Achromobacter spanius TaxID=217203 RepID=UPI002226EFC9|nr:hypothetical protein [Achromobacter spanius]MCW3151726.1 hypothetical protein [Achromobacter spanius]
MLKKQILMTYMLLIGVCSPLSANAFASNSDGTITPDWQVFKNTVSHYRIAIGNKESIENAREAESRGKKAFLEGRLDKADYQGYGDAIASLPKPEYFFIVGDIALRNKLSLHSDSPYATQEYKSCWDKYLFALDVKGSIESNFERGFGLVEELNLTATRISRIYKQAMTNASCFARLTSKYSEGVGPQCVPIEEVKTCLGSPLLFLYH